MTKKKIICIDGDGSLLMHLGSLTSLASLNPKNFYHILLNNEVHESVGGQETAAKYLDLSNIIKSFCPSEIFKAETREDLLFTMQKFINTIGPSFLEVKIMPGSRENLGRPKLKPINNKEKFMDHLMK